MNAAALRSRLADLRASPPPRIAVWSSERQQRALRELSAILLELVERLDVLEPIYAAWIRDVRMGIVPPQEADAEKPHPVARSQGRLRRSAPAVAARYAASAPNGREPPPEGTLGRAIVDLLQEDGGAWTSREVLDALQRRDVSAKVSRASVCVYLSRLQRRGHLVRT